jgi:hypothetical protein
MVAKIKSGKSLIGALNYNENKVKQDKAELIEAKDYYKDMQELNFYDKLLRLTDLAEGNTRTVTNAVHISLNFPNGELLPNETLKDIVKDYMTGIGFEMQPWLVYRHNDAGHPHIHIVTTNIKRNGERISLHYLGQNQSEKTRKEIEVKYQLIKAQDQPKRKPDLKAEPADYGKAETKRVITNIVNQVVRSYKFTSVPELNAVLQQYHIQADRGSKDSRMYAREGLVYWILDRQGNKVGVPIKASSIYGKPTLKALNEKFTLNEQLRKPFKAELIKTIDTALAKHQTKAGFQKTLSAKGIQVILRQNDEGRIYGVTFIDQNNKAVFNGSDLGKAYSANLLSAKFQQEEPIPKTMTNPQTRDQTTSEANTPASNNQDEVLDILFTPEREDLAALNKFKKKRKGLNL